LIKDVNSAGKIPRNTYVLRNRQMTKRLKGWWHIIEFNYIVIATTARSADDIDSGFISPLHIILVKALGISR